MTSAGLPAVGSHTRSPCLAFLCGAFIEQDHGVAEQFVGFLGRGGKPGQAISPGLEFHSSFQVYAPDHDITACRERCEDDIEDT